LERGEEIPARARLEQLVEWVQPAANEPGVTPWLAAPQRNAAERQNARHAVGATMEDILAEQVADGRLEEEGMRGGPSGRCGGARGGGPCATADARVRARPWRAAGGGRCAGRGQASSRASAYVLAGSRATPVREGTVAARARRSRRQSSPRVAGMSDAGGAAG